MFQKYFGSFTLALLATLISSTSVWAQVYSRPSAAKAPNSGTVLYSLEQGRHANAYGNSGRFNAPSSSSMPPSSYGAGRVGSGYGGSKPFQSYSAKPTVSPYLNLFRDDFSGTKDFNYSTLVQPQLQQQQVNQQLERQNLQTNRRLQSIAAQADFNPQGSKDEAPTGHQTVFQYTGRYYSLPMTRAKRR